MDKKGPVETKQFNLVYAYLVLAIIFLVRVVVNWQGKSLGYFFGFSGQGVLAGDPIFEIGKAYPKLGKYYGLLVGPAHTIPTAIFGLIAGGLTQTGNRKMMLLGVLTILSGFHFAYGLVDSFSIFMTLQILSQALKAAISPMCFSLLADYFPPDQRTTANSILSSAKVVGIALSSITVLLIQKVGWRASYLAIGATGLVATVAGLVSLRTDKALES